MPADGASRLTRTPATGPLAGIRVIDCSTVLAGPYCTMLLADLGADVVKVEPPEGDATRGWGPPWVGTGADDRHDGGDQADPGTAAYYLAANRNKRSIRLDLKAAAGRAVLRRLLADADVVVENHRVGGFAALGFDDATLDAINPRLVHLSLTGFGPTGPEARTPGYDFVIQAMAGVMSITGEADDAGGRPLKVGVAISDLTTGMLAAVGILAALEGRGRPGSPAYGLGQRIDISLFESTLAWMANQAQNALVTGRAPGRRGNAHPNIVPYETFRTADGEIAVAVGSERQWPRLCDALGLAELADDPRFATNGDRVRERSTLIPLLAERFLADGSATWLARLAEAEIPSGPIAGVLDALHHPQAEARGVLVEVEHPVLGTVTQVKPPFDLSATPASVRTPPPLLGEQTDEILREAGYALDEIAALRAEGVV